MDQDEMGTSSTMARTSRTSGINGTPDAPENLQIMFEMESLSPRMLLKTPKKS